MERSRVALVTGASGGIGQAVAFALHEMGARVAVACFRRRDRAEEVADAIRRAGGDAAVFVADLRQPAEALSLVDQVERRFGRLDVLVNNAGTALEKLLIDTTAEEWDELMALHVRAAFLCTKAALPGMIRRRFGRIINVTSMWGQVGAANEVAYSTAKAALIGFTKALAKEVGSAGITVNAVAPGVIRTEMLAGYPPEALEELVERTPAGRLGEPGDVARVVRFLAADEADFITGQIVAPNGGFVV